MTIKFHKNLYHSGTLKKAAIAFAGLARIEIKKKAGYIFVSFYNIKPGSEKAISGEFGNYVLFLENK
jgi:hypothetical protein